MYQPPDRRADFVQSFRELCRTWTAAGTGPFCLTGRSLNDCHCGYYLPIEKVRHSDQVRDVWSAPAIGGTMRRLLRGRHGDERGQGLLEYAMVLGFCSVLAAGALTNLGQSIVTALYEPVVSVF